MCKSEGVLAMATSPISESREVPRDGRGCERVVINATEVFALPLSD
jgi:hypothetical protein